MTSAKLAFLRYHRVLIVALLSMVASVLFVGLSSSFASASDGGGSGTYNTIQLARQNVFTAHVENTEYVHFQVQDGYYDNPLSKNNGGHIERCAYIIIYYPDNATIADKKATCNGGNIPYSSATDVKIQNNSGTAQNYRVVLVPKEAFDKNNDSNPNNDVDPFKILLKRCNNSGDTCDTQGYTWKVWVNNNAGVNDNGLQLGRVWADQVNGLRVWQSTRKGNNHGAATTTLEYHRADLEFVYARKDGYRYRVDYNNFHGIWSEFYSGVYGIFDAAGKNLVYQSVNKTSGNKVQTYDDNGNNAYLFVDCRDTYMECGGIQTSLGLSSIYPIASDGGDKNGNPIKVNPNHTSDTLSDGSNNNDLRIIGLNSAGANYAGGTVKVQYIQMQSGYIHFWLTDATVDNNVHKCDINIPVSEADGIATATWSLPWGAGCPNIPTTHKLGVYAQAIHLGEMHFINTDVEARDGVTIRGNGLYEAAPRNASGLIYNDPFSTAGSKMCGSLVRNYQFSGGFQSNANDATGTGVDRRPIDSNISGGVHGWKTNSCDNTAGAGTGSSVWGNARNIEDWVYSFKNPLAIGFTIGGPGYVLTPSVTATPERVSAGQPVTFSYSVTNNKSTSGSTAWSVRSIVIAPGASASLPADYFDGFDGTRSCASYYNKPGVVSCAEVNAPVSRLFPGPITTLPDETAAQSYAVGTRICRALTVDSYNEDPAPNPRISPLTCAIVGVTPSLQVWGSDVRVGSAFVTGSNRASSVKSFLTFVDPNYRGSWGEYGVIAPGSVSNFSSGSGLNAPATSSDALTWSKLTFANQTVGSLGNFTSEGNLGQIPDVKGYLTKAAARAGLALKQLAGPVSLGSYEGDTVYIVGDTVTITNDIKTNSPKTGAAALTQMVIIAKNINIAPNVKQIDAWLIAIPNGDGTGVINTCVLGVADQRLATDRCTETLQINGPLMADTVLPRRTSGQGSAPAEVFDLRGDAYIWARRVSEQNGSIHTTYIKELPPRY